MQAVVAIFGIAWMGDTFLNGNMTELRASIEGVVTSMPWLFGIALFVMSILLYSQAATVRALMPLGIALGISPWMLVALFPCRERLFFSFRIIRPSSPRSISTAPVPPGSANTC